MIHALRLPSLALAALLLLSQGSARVLLECATRAHPPASLLVESGGAKHDADAHAHHGAGRTHTGASPAAHDAGMAEAGSDAPPACEAADAGCTPGDDSARCELMPGCAAPAAPAVATGLAAASVATAAIAGPVFEPSWAHREPATPPPRG